ncbi:hypothetical protein FRB90_002429 [Tulasnella sp. 427]|nr:hypothetical protein FRB90_002429 [Tulasnella sp. 427]
MLYQEQRSNTFRTLFSRSSKPPRRRLKSGKSQHQETPLGYQKGSKLIQLPDYILFMIVYSLSNRNTVSLIRTCRYFRELLEPTLYRHLNVGLPSLLKESLHSTLVIRPDLSRSIQSYTDYLGPLPILSQPSSRWPLPRQKPKSQNQLVAGSKLYRDIITVISQAPNIREINFSGSVDWAANPIWTQVTQAICQLPLRKLTYSVGTNDNENVLCQLLASQSSLEELVLYGNAPNLVHLGPAALPKLKHLDTMFQEALAIIPGRPIEALRLRCYSTDRDMDATGFRQFTLSRGKIRTVTISCLCGRGQAEERLRGILVAIGQSLPDVETLTLAVGATVSAQVIDFTPSNFLATLPQTFRRKPTSRNRECSNFPRTTTERFSIASTPMDIIFYLSWFLDVHDKASLLKTCRHFRQILEPALYRPLDLIAPLVCYTSDKAHRTLLERQDLIPYILSYRGPLLTTTIVYEGKLFRGKDSGQDWGDQNFRAAITIFSQAINIRDLQFTDWVDWTSDPIWEPVKLGVSKMKLRSLGIRAGGDAQNVYRVLQAQPLLEYLELGWETKDLDKLQTADLPELKSLRATLSEAAALVPSRPVQDLDLLSSTMEYTEELLSKLALSTGPISTMSVRFHEPEELGNVRNILRMLASALPHVQDLTVTFGGDVFGKAVRRPVFQDVRSANIDRHDIPQLLETIPLFKSLRRLYLIDVDLIHDSTLPLIPPYGSAESSLAPQEPVLPSVSYRQRWEQVARRRKAQCPSLVDFSTVPRLFASDGEYF